jgi:hypothetical protein
VLAVVSLLSIGATACGSRTGLDQPDAQVDAGGLVDAGPVEPPVRCIEVPDPSMPVAVDFVLPVSLAVVDVFFLIDATASMRDEIDNVREGLSSTVVPGVRAAIPDAAFGLSLAGEFPEEPHGPPEVRPYELRVPITQDVPRIEASLAEIPRWGNFDDPEAQVEALYQVATGEGLPPWISPSLGCPRGGSGGVCFRDDSLPVVVLITDAPFHNGPDGEDRYELRPDPHSYAEAVRALAGLGIFVIGLGARDAGRPSPMPHLRRIAADTGAINAAGGPLAFDIGASGDGVGRGIVDAVSRLAEGLPLDVDAVAQDVLGDAVDARRLIAAIRPVRASPPTGVSAILDDRFEGVVPGTRVTFEVVIDASVLEPTDSTQRIPALILFRAFGRSLLGQERIEIVIAGLDGGGCEEE